MTRDPLLDLAVRILRNHAGGIADEACWKLECQLAALRLGQQARRQSTADCVQLEFRDRALGAEQEPTIGRPRIINAVAIGNQAGTMTAHVE